MSVNARFRARILANAKEAERKSIEAANTGDDVGMMHFLDERERFELMLIEADALPVDMPDQIEQLKSVIGLCS